jgi:hypothetical protein
MKQIINQLFLRYCIRKFYSNTYPNVNLFFFSVNIPFLNIYIYIYIYINIKFRKRNLYLLYAQ